MSLRACTTVSQAMSAHVQHPRRGGKRQRARPRTHGARGRRGRSGRGLPAGMPASCPLTRAFPRRSLPDTSPVDFFLAATQEVEVNTAPRQARSWSHVHADNQADVIARAAGLEIVFFMPAIQASFAPDDSASSEVAGARAQCHARCFPSWRTVFHFGALRRWARESDSLPLFPGPAERRRGGLWHRHCNSLRGSGEARAALQASFLSSRTSV